MTSKEQTDSVETGMVSDKLASPATDPNAHPSIPKDPITVQLPSGKALDLRSLMVPPGASLPFNPQAAKIGLQAMQDQTSMFGTESLPQDMTTTA